MSGPQKYVFDGQKLIYHADRVAQYCVAGDCFPLYMEISLVGRCNHRCIFCAYDFIGYPNRSLKTGRLLEFIAEAKECGMRSILLAGEGEPCLHPDLAQVVAHIKKSGIDVGIFSNGQLLTRELLEAILPHLTFLRFSFNAGSPENYTQIHRVKPEVFTTVLSAMKTAAEVKKAVNAHVDIGAQYVLIPENQAFLKDAVLAVRASGIGYLAIKPFVQQSSQQGYSMQGKPDIAAIGVILEDAERLSTADFKVIARKDSFAHYNQRLYTHCLGTSFVSVMNSAGDIASCLPYWDKKEFIFGNIYESSFKEIWASASRRKIKEYLEQSLDAGTCPPNCRPHMVNEFLWEIKNPSVKHVNFI